MITIVLSFKRLTQPELTTFTNNVIQKMTTDSQFSGLKPQVDALKTTYEQFMIAYANAAQGGKDRVKEKNTRLDALIEQLTTVARYIELLPNSTDETAEMAGFEVRKPKKPINELAVPTKFKVVNEERHGSLRFSWDAVGGAVNYAIEYLVKGKDQWQNGIYSTSKDIIYPGFTPGDFIEFHVKAIGRKEITSDWSETVGIYVS